MLVMKGAVRVSMAVWVGRKQFGGRKDGGMGGWGEVDVVG